MSTWGEQIAEIQELVTRLEDDPQLKDLVCSVHHAASHSFTNTDTIKIVENHHGIGRLETVEIVAVGSQPQEGGHPPTPATPAQSCTASQSRTRP